MIETLLPKAVASEAPFHLLEMWADTARPRKGWIGVSEERGETETLAEN